MVELELYERPDRLRAQAARRRLERRLPARGELAGQPALVRMRHAVGFGLVEAGLRLVVGRSAHPPDSRTSRVVVRQS